jgi:hypothetical protein
VPYTLLPEYPEILVLRIPCFVQVPRGLLNRMADRDVGTPVPVW